MNKQRLVNTLMDILKIDSPAKSERVVADYLIEYFRTIGIQLVEDAAGEKIGGNSGNLYAFIPGDSAVEPVVFLAHMDTVAPTFGLHPKLDESFIRSDGNTVLGGDDKAGVAVLCEMARIISEATMRHRPVEIIFTIAEEIGLYGIKHFDHSKIKSKFAYVLDTFGPAGNIITKSPSLERISISILGKAAHAGSKPEHGINAIAIAADAISKIKQGRIDEETTLNLGTIKGGEATNIVPHRVEIAGECRSFNKEKLDEQIKIVEHDFLESAKKFGGEIEFSHRLSFTTFNINEESQAVQIAVNAARRVGLKHNITKTGGGSDANVLNLNGIQSVVLATGYYNEHTNQEYISLDDLYKCLEFVLGLAT